MSSKKDGEVSLKLSTVAGAVAGVANPMAGAAITLIGVISDFYFSKSNEKKQEKLTEGFCEKLNIESTELSDVMEEYKNEQNCIDAIIEFSKKAVLTYSKKSIKLMGKLLAEIVTERRNMTALDFAVLDLFEKMNDYDLGNLVFVKRVFDENNKEYNEGIYAEVDKLKECCSNDIQVLSTFNKLQNYYALEVQNDVSIEENGNFIQYMGQFYSVTDIGYKILTLL